ncbi:MAG: COX15/CtaA family protein [Kiritimatiellae bacterium]|jgi:cytochrome c oxidase assembly protein subunit 15|nr:COX15/CtaA family protein [Kiritimatiellia bacterium]
MNIASHLPFPAARKIALWLWMVCTLIVLMVAVGGVTRLTESGLSMVQWEPVTGFLPPRTTEAWQEAFDLYKRKAGAQFAKFSADREMTLSDYQEIYFWEYAHRVLGRVIGLAYALPFFYFLIRETIPTAWKIKLGIGLLLGGAQGVLGWFMVTSGFADLPYVSHFRLAAHLGLALFVFAYLFWLTLDLIPFWTHRKENYDSIKRLRLATAGFLGLLCLQIVYGAFTAGLRAGYMYNSYPRMGRGLIPPDAVSETFGSWIRNTVYNPVLVQFLHRHLGLLVVVCALALWGFAMKKHLMPRQKLAFNALLVTVTLQFVLGVFTLVSGMNMMLAVSHQVCACFLLASVVMALHELTEPKTVTSRRS